MTISAGVITCNEEQTIGALLAALTAPENGGFRLAQIVVVSAECRDRTDDIVRAAAADDPRIELVVEPVRRGKSAAVNAFLAARRASDVTLLTSGDVRPAPDALAALVTAFHDPRVGMAGGRPTPINPPTNLTGRMAALMWQLHHEIALQNPKLGETVLFRSALVTAIPEDSPVDEASIEAAVLAQNFRLRYIPEAIIHNRGPDSLAEWLGQRRRIAYGHRWLARKHGHRVATSHDGSLMRLMGRHVKNHPGQALPAVALIFLEALARILALADTVTGKKNHAVWKIAPSTKKSQDA